MREEVEKRREDAGERTGVGGMKTEDSSGREREGRKGGVRRKEEGGV